MNYEIIHQQVLDRDNYTCQNCLKKDIEENLVVHHLIPRRFGVLNSLNNLVTLCKVKCHALLEIGRHRDLTSHCISRTIRKETYYRVLELGDGKYGETFNDILERVLSQQNTGGKNKELIEFQNRVKKVEKEMYET